MNINLFKFMAKDLSIKGYYIDIDAIFNYCFIDNNENKQREISDNYEYDDDGKLVLTQKIAHEVTIPKYENGISNEKLKLINYFITVVFDYSRDEMNDCVAYEIAFNTLVNNGIIKKK